MAKIALVADQLNSVSLAFAHSLQQQSQEVIFLTSKNDSFSHVPPFQILTPFKTWSLLEGFRVLPQLTSWNPDIWHFLFTHEDSRTRPAHWLLASFASALPQKTLVASFFSSNQVKSRIDLAFLKLVDLRTFATRSHLMRVKRNLTLSHRSLNEVLPPIEHPLEVETSKIRPEIEKMRSSLGSYVVVPDSLPKELNPKWFQKHGIEILLLSDQFGKKNFCTGPVNAVEREYLLSHSLALVLAGCDLSVIELQRFHELSEKTKTPVIATRYQVEVFPGLCWHLKSGWILENSLFEIPGILDQHPQLDLPKEFSGITKNELTDATLNELLRLYGRAFSSRWS